MKSISRFFTKQYIPVLNLILVSILLGISLSFLFSSKGTMSWISLICSFVFVVLTFDSIRQVRAVLFKIKDRHSKAFGKTLSASVVALVRPRKNHPLLDAHVTAYYEVPTLSGGLTYVERRGFYKWLVRVWTYQRSQHRQTQQSPLARRKWEGELGGYETYQAYMYILETCQAIDPESSYHVKRLRMSPWNIVILADDKLDTISL